MIAARVPIFNSSVRDRVTGLFRGGPADTAGRVGVEIEVFGARRKGGALVPAGRADLEPLLAANPAITAGAAPTFEPGGQLELSLEPAPDVFALAEHARSLLGALAGAAARADLVTFTCGADPLSGRMAWDLQVDGPRYRVMQDHFDRVGGRGRRMMRQTAALQVCVETPPGRAGVDAWLVLNRAGPAIAAAFSDSPVLEHLGRGVAGNRLAVWLETDASRTGFDGAQVDGSDPVDAYAEFALDALALPLPRCDRGGGNGPVPPPPGTLRDWLRCEMHGGAEPDAADVERHLTTLFPPVRPRGAYLEVRFLDALPWAEAHVAILLVALLAQDAAARTEALERLPEPPSMLALWQRACRSGPRDHGLARQACELLDIAARAAARRGPRGIAGERLLRDYGERFPRSGRCPGDDLALALERTPEALCSWM